MRKMIGITLLVWAWTAAAAALLSAAESYTGDLRWPVASVRRHAAKALCTAADRSAVPALIAALGDSEKGVRREAAKALGLIKDDRAVAALLNALSDSDGNVRLYAAYALGEIKDARAAGPLVSLLRDPEWTVRDQAAWALREIRDPQIAGPLVDLLKEKNADVAHIAWILQHLELRQTAGHLAGLLNEPDATARARAVQVLAQLQGAEAVASLIAALKDADSGVRRRAVEALAGRGDIRAAKPLTELAARETDASVREAAERAALRLSRHDALAAHWSFDDQNTEIAKDVTGRGSDGQIRGCTPVEGKAGHALRFGADACIELGKPEHLPIANTPLTVAAWVKTDAPNGVVVARGGAFCGFSLYLKNGLPRFGIRQAQDSPAYIAAGEEPVTGSWTHLAGVIRSDRIELYVNGKLAGAAEEAGYIPGNCGQGMEIGFDIGNSPAEITDHFQGIIDEVKVFHAAISQEEIANECQTE